MEITKCNSKVKCELGGCKNRAEHMIKFDRVGIRGGLFVCDGCLKELYGTIGKTLVPKSIETAKQKRKKTERG